MSKLISRNSDE